MNVDLPLLEISRNVGGVANLTHNVNLLEDYGPSSTLVIMLIFGAIIFFVNVLFPPSIAGQKQVFYFAYWNLVAYIEQSISGSRFIIL